MIFETAKPLRDTSTIRTKPWFPRIRLLRTNGPTDPPILSLVLPVSRLVPCSEQSGLIPRYLSNQQVLSEVSSPSHLAAPMKELPAPFANVERKESLLNSLKTRNLSFLSETTSEKSISTELAAVERRSCIRDYASCTTPKAQAIAFTNATST